MGNEKSIFTSKLPENLLETAKSHAKYLKIYDFILKSVTRLNKRLLDALKIKKTTQRPKTGIIYVALEFEPYQAAVCDFLRVLATNNEILDKNAPGKAR